MINKELVKTRFKDVAGCDEAKREVITLFHTALFTLHLYYCILQYILIYKYDPSITSLPFYTTFSTSITTAGV